MQCEKVHFATIFWTGTTIKTWILSYEVKVIEKGIGGSVFYQQHQPTAEIDETSEKNIYTSKRKQWIYWKRIVSEFILFL